MKNSSAIKVLENQQKQLKVQIEFCQKKLKELYKVKNLSNASFKSLSEQRASENQANEKEAAMGFEGKLEAFELIYDYNRELIYNLSK